MRNIPLLFGILILQISAQFVLADLKVSAFFGDHMVLQREQTLPVWGQADPGEKVTISFRDKIVRAEAGPDGKWIVLMPKQSVGEPTTLKVVSGDEQIVFKDVLIGEVWVCSGQSNMAWPVEKSNDANAEIAAADYPNIRLYKIPRTYSPDPIEKIDATWEICSPETIGPFSAVAYYFGRKVHKELDVPIGLVSTSWGGTPAEAWTPLDVLQSRPEYADAVARIEKVNAYLTANKNAEEKLQKAYEDFQETVFGLAEFTPDPEAKWFDPEHSFDALKTVAPSELFMTDTDGLSHVRAVFTLDDTQASQPGARVRLGQIDNYDVTWINGVKVGKTGRKVENARWVARDYAILDGTLKVGKNVILLQIVDVYQNAYFGYKVAQPEIYWPDGQTLALKDWKMEVVVDLGPRPDTLQRKVRNTGSYLYNGMIAPLIPAAFRGVIWYQGESNAKRAAQYNILFPDMIQSWREAWGRGDFPFYFVQLANIDNRNGWPELREAQLKTLKLPNTGMAVTIDIGDAEDVHPRNKQDVGKRLALWALAKTYGQKEPVCALGRLPLMGRLFQKPIPHSGPLFRKASIRGDEIHLHFDHTNGGLKTRDGEAPVGFMIAEKDGTFKAADARIEGDRVILSHPEMTSPIEVRYAWATNPSNNLINESGLPASPFRANTRCCSEEE